MNRKMKAFARAAALLAAVLMATGCAGLNSMNQAVLGLECEGRSDCMRQAGLPGNASGDPKFSVAPYSIESQSVKALVGTPAIGGGSFSADLDVIIMKAIRDAYPSATIIPGGEVAGSVFISPFDANVQAYGFGGLKCEIDFKAKYGSVQSDIHARGTVGPSWTMKGAMADSCSEMKSEVSKAIKEFVDVNVYKKAVAKPNE
ncbi:MAG: hypothetical protein GX423_07725 [Nitrospiraceae bacterium]|nr:hypothetical protein [Nitrospiraceae bacterium]